jgi:hypothetical protein
MAIFPAFYSKFLRTLVIIVLAFLSMLEFSPSQVRAIGYSGSLVSLSIKSLSGDSRTLSLKQACNLAKFERFRIEFLSGNCRHSLMAAENIIDSRFRTAHALFIVSQTVHVIRTACKRFPIIPTAEVHVA